MNSRVEAHRGYGPCWSQGTQVAPVGTARLPYVSGNETTTDTSHGESVQLRTTADERVVGCQRA